MSTDHEHYEPTEEEIARVEESAASDPTVLAEGPPTNWAPTRKWLAARVTALTAVIVLLAAHGWHFDEHTLIPLGGFIAEALSSYGVRNKATPGGV